MNTSTFSARALAAFASLAAVGACRVASTAPTTPVAQASASTPAPAQAPGPRYKLQKIADVEVADGAKGLNNRGQVLLGTEGSKIVLWQDGKLRFLPAVARTRAGSSRRSGRSRSVAIWDALDINDRGQIAGLASDGQACVYHNGKLQLLGAMGKSGKWDSKGANPIASERFIDRNTGAAINQAGDIVGTSYTPQPTERVFTGARSEGATQSWLLRRAGSGSALLLPLGKYGCYARDINAGGHVVGSFSQDTTGEGFSIDRAFVWDSASNQRRDLGEGFANAINNKGQAVGGTGDAVNNDEARALLWQDGQKSDLGLGEALDINAAGQVVGQAKTDDKWKSMGAMLWQDGQRIMLKDRLDKDYKVRLDSARLINDRGQIVVLAYPAADALAYYALLTPVGG